MSNNLPYFRFNSFSWISEDISIEDYNVKGVFIDVCAYYWLSDCNRTHEQIKRRFKDALTEVQTLIKGGFIKVDADGFISISFLDSQWSMLEETRKKLSLAGKKSVKARRKKKAESIDNKEMQTKVKPTLNLPLSPPLNYKDKEKDKEKDNEKSNNTPAKTKNTKSKYLEFVTLEDEERDKLIAKHGQRKFDLFIEKLNNHKGSTGQKYKSDYYAILKWVVKAVEHDLKKTNADQPKISIPKPLTDDDL